MALSVQTYEASPLNPSVRLWCACVLVLLLGHASSAASEVQVWNFDQDSLSTASAGFHVGTLFDGRPAGDWQVVSSDKATSPPHVLAQLHGKGAEHAYKLVLVQGTEAEDIELSVMLLPIAGKADMGGGLIWRAADDRNYYLVRANPLEQNIRVYRVVNGVRHMIQNFDHVIDIRQWHRLRVQMRGCDTRVWFDEQAVFTLCDRTFAKGYVGLWTKSDAITYFDDLQFQKTR
jgi:hypothetical protein